jgi:16S rRNA A1518/A1519 N6-dimethyltransferase RsmA/KsgA/DIM1 with predicted DNA glycosylase/AP lyase activity
VAVRRRPAREASGRHFLRSRQLASELVAGARLARGDVVVEIGGGTGVLTHALARAGAEVIAIERDAALAAGLRSRFADSPSVRIVQADATACEWPAEPFVVVSNLPFVRSGAILERLLRDPRAPLRGAHVIVQWELAAKQSAVWPATLRSTYWRAWYEISIARRLHRSAFAPPPSVDCAVLCLERLAHPRVPLELHESYWRFLSGAFAAREPIRRGLRPSLSALEVKRLAPALGFAPDARPWEIDAGQWASLFAFARSR